MRPPRLCLENLDFATFLAEITRKFAENSDSANNFANSTKRLLKSFFSKPLYESVMCTCVCVTSFVNHPSQTEEMQSTVCDRGGDGGGCEANGEVSSATVGVRKLPSE